MGTEAQKSTVITNLDGTPIILPTAGIGAPARLWSITDNVTATAGVTSPSTYRLCRMPSNFIIKQVLVYSVAQGGSSAVDIDIAYSDSTTDGTSSANTGNIPQISSADNKAFGSAFSLVSAVKNTDQTFGNIWTPTQQNLELWSALNNLGASGLSTDPGGFFDILLKSTATITNGGQIGVEVRGNIGD